MNEEEIEDMTESVRVLRSLCRVGLHDLYMDKEISGKEFEEGLRALDYPDSFIKLYM